MCGWAIDLITTKSLTAKQKATIRKDLERRRKVMQAQINQLDKVLKRFQQKVKRAARAK